MPGLTVLLMVLGAVLVFVQVGLAVEVIITGFRELGALKVAG